MNKLDEALGLVLKGQTEIKTVEKRIWLPCTSHVEFHCRKRHEEHAYTWMATLDEGSTWGINQVTRAYSDCRFVVLDREKE